MRNYFPQLLQFEFDCHITGALKINYAYPRLPEINFELISKKIFWLVSASQVAASVELFRTCCHLSLLPYHRSLCRKAGKGQCCFSGLAAVVGLAGIFESLKMCGKGSDLFEVADYITCTNSDNKIMY
jgi:hypothetical protein